MPRATQPRVLHAQLAFDAHFDHATLGAFVAATEQALLKWRLELDGVLAGERPAEFKAFIKGPASRPIVPNTGPPAAPPLKRLLPLVDSWLAAYNDLGTGLRFARATNQPTCVRYEWINGERVAIYNYSLTETPPNPVGHGRPPAVFHAVISHGVD